MLRKTEVFLRVVNLLLGRVMPKGSQELSPDYEFGTSKFGDRSFKGNKG